MNNPATAPTSWPALIEARSPALPGRLEAIGQTKALMSRLRPPFHPGDAVGGAVRTLAEALLLLGPDRCTDALRLLSELIEEAARDMDPRRPGRVPTTLGLLGLVVIAENTGLIQENAHRHLTEKWIDALFNREFALEPVDGLAAGALASALGYDREADGFLRAASDTLAPASPERYDFAGFVTLLFGGVSNSTPAAQLRIAWEDFLAAFPRLLGSGITDWNSLHALARVFLGRIAHVPAAEVAAATHREAMQAVARSS